MKFELRLPEITDLLGSEAEPAGNYEGTITGIASLEEATPGDLSFCSGPRFRRQLSESRASVVLVKTGMGVTPPDGALYLFVSHPSLALARICALVEHLLWPSPEPGIHSTAVVDPTAEIDQTASIGPHCVIGPGSRIGSGAHLVAQVHVGRQSTVGAGTWMAPQSVLGDYCELGARCRIHAGTVLGSDGFGYEPDGNALTKLPQVGRVVVEDDVEIGALTAIDRARFAETRIGAGTKIDNQVHIAHNVRIGKCSAIAAQVGISGSVEIGDGVLIYGQAGLAGHLSVGSGAVIAGGAAVTKDIESGRTVRGIPAMDRHAHDRLAALQRKLPEFVKRIEMLEEFRETLERGVNARPTPKPS